MQNNRRHFIKTMALGTAGLATASLASAKPVKKPNVIMVLVDDLGWTDIGCYGSTYYETPNIDRLAREGMKFSDGYAACAVCSPTRAAIMTGRWPSRLGVTDWIRSRFQGGAIPADGKNPSGYTSGGPKTEVLCPKNALWMENYELTIAEMLKTAGYISCHIGKWHLGPDAQYPKKQGFDYNFGGCDYGQPPSYHDPYTNKTLKQGIPTLKPRKEGEYLTDREGDEAVAFIKKHAKGPFFLNLDHYAVHTPIQGRADLVEKYKAKTPTHQKNATYAAMVESVDHAMGKVLAALDEVGVADNTLIIFTGDNGGLLGPTNNAPLRSGKGYPYEGGIREPLIVRWPGRVRPGSQSAEPVTSVDYFPTICEAAGVALPKDRPIDGLSIVPLLAEKNKKLDRDAILWHFPHYRGSVMPYSIIRSGPWKLIKRYAGPKPFELFNLEQDLSEKTDLAEKMPKKVATLDKKLIALLKNSNAKMPKPNPQFVAKK